VPATGDLDDEIDLDDVDFDADEIILNNTFNLLDYGNYYGT